MTELLLKEEVYAIVGAAIEVHSELGPGFLEAVYQEVMEHELTARGIPYRSQVGLEIKYKGSPIQKQYIADLVCYERIIVELKAARALTGTDDAQVLNYLKATGMRVGLIFNFGSFGKLEWNRLVR